MMQRTLRSVNLNLLPILQSLLTTRNVTRTAEQLHMSQSAVSEALGKLRHQFNDELLVKVGREMQPTPLARSIEDRLHACMVAIEELVQQERFDPSVLSRRFLVATADTVVLAIASALIDRLQAAAPTVSVQFVDMQGIDPQALRTGELDMIIMPKGVLDTEDLIDEPLYDETFVCIARKNHPAIKRGLTRAAFDALTHVAFRTDHHSELTFETTLVGTRQKDVIRLPHFTLLPALVEESDAVALIQKRAAEHYAGRYDIQVFEPPLEVPTVSLAGFWARIHDRDPAHQWFRSQVQQAAAAIGG